MIKSLIINPGSTSTKVGIFEDETLVKEETLRHSTEEINQYATIIDQKDFRKNIILKDRFWWLRFISLSSGKIGI